MTWVRYAVVLALLSVVSCSRHGCSRGPSSVQPSPESTAPRAATLPAEQAAKSTPYPTSSHTEDADVPAVLQFHFIIRDRQGRPLPGIGVLAADQPNAFTEPVARGTLSDADGNAYLEAPPNRLLFLRGWDPDLRYFSNNFYEVPPSGPGTRDNLVITMVEAARLRAQVTHESLPVAGETVTLMLVHPQYGPWWPAESITDAAGNVEFAPVPPGEFLLRLQTQQGYGMEKASTPIPPGSITDLGMLEVRPLLP